MKYVYFAKHPKKRLIKIGVSGSPRDRVKCLPGQPDLLGVIPGDHSAERAMHKKFACFAVGHEWFHDCEAIRSFIFVSDAAAGLSELKGPSRVVGLRISAKLMRKLKAKAKIEHRRPSAMVAIIAEEYFTTGPGASQA
jgi:hypothetical protein